MKTIIGVLSDTHLSGSDLQFRKQARKVFSGCSIIIHAGDINDLRVLDVFTDKTVHAVHGNMCSFSTRQVLPESLTIDIDGCTIGICHGAGNKYDIEDRLIDKFPNVDCIIYGHTHIPSNHRFGDFLLLNPGSFIGTGPYGNTGTYALLSIESGLPTAKIYQIPTCHENALDPLAY